MDKEMKAKIDEVLKTNGKRELSLDEMDKVSGGTDILMNGNVVSEAEAYNVAMALFDQFGYDIAAEMFCTMTNIDKYEIKRTRRRDASDKESMELLVYRCAQIYDKGHGY